MLLEAVADFLAVLGCLPISLNMSSWEVESAVGNFVGGMFLVGVRLENVLRETTGFKELLLFLVFSELMELRMPWNAAKGGSSNPSSMIVAGGEDVGAGGMFFLLGDDSSLFSSWRTGGGGGVGSLLLSLAV